MYCIYTITCKLNNKIYIGYTSNFKDRERRHFNSLKNNRHVNSHLQSAYNLYGKEMFNMKILVFCTKETAPSEEHYWCNILNTHDRNFGYNIALTNPNNIGIKLSKESNEKRSITMTGRKSSESHIENMRKARLGSKNSENSKNKVKEWFKENGHPSKGVQRSQETRDKMSLSAKNRKNKNNL